MLQKSSILETLNVFFEEPTKRHYLIDISRRISLAHTSVKNNIQRLIDLGFIKREVETKGTRKFHVYIANKEYKKFTQIKKISNLSSLLESGLIDLLEKNLMPKCVVLFGSYSRGEDIEESDIDLFIGSKKAEINLTTFEKKLKRKIELHFKENFKGYPKELKNNIINGIVLSGFLEGY